MVVRSSPPNVDFDVEEFHVQLLVRLDPPDISTAEYEGLEQAHLAYLFGEQAAGRLAVAGAITDHPRYVGLGLWRTGSVDETRARTDGDPGVKAGIYANEIVTWIMPKGLLQVRTTSLRRGDLEG